MVGVVGSSPIAPTKYKPKQVFDLLGLFGFRGRTRRAHEDESGTALPRLETTASASSFTTAGTTSFNPCDHDVQTVFATLGPKGLKIAGS